MKPGLLIVGIAILVISAACGREGRYSPSPPPVPRYPNIQQLQEEQIRPGVNEIDEERVSIFTTGDSPEAVLRFYRENLPGWDRAVAMDGGKARERPGEYITNTCPFYFLEISAEQLEAATTRVRVRFQRTACK